MVFLPSKLLALLASLLRISVDSRPAPREDPNANRTFGKLCLWQGIHCIFSAPGIIVTGGSIYDVKHYPPGNAAWEQDPKKFGGGTATGCDGDVVDWYFNGTLSVFDGGSNLTNRRMHGFFTENSDQIIVNGIITTATIGADVCLYCGPSSSDA